jgi:hypothetical protein
MGFTLPCSMLWAHSAATSVNRCNEVCLVDATGLTILNGPPPACEFQTCLSCSGVWQNDLDALAGRTLQNSGITERIARPCEDFARIVHDPCTMVEVLQPSTPSPTEDEPGAGGLPVNDRCVNSIRLQENVEVDGNTAMANFDFVNQGVCGPESDRPGIWYEIGGRGGTVTIKLCSNNDRATVFGVFAQCNSHDCVGFVANVAGGGSCTNPITRVSYSFPSEVGQSYFLHVREADSGAGGANFNIVYAEAADEVPGPTPAPVAPPPATVVLCGSEPCIVDVPQSCDALLAEYNFVGSCCSLESIIAIDACRITVWNGNCLWVPKCGLCDPAAECNLVFETTAIRECIASAWDPLSQPSTDPTPTCAPIFTPGNGAVRVENFALSVASPVSCDVIIESSSFDGDCCSLSSTDGNGCVLNVVNGRCIVSDVVGWCAKPQLRKLTDTGTSLF